MKRGSGDEEAGFTLIEVMIAAAILGFVILGIGSLSTFTTRTTTYARRATAAATIARNAIEEARNTPYANLPALDTNPPGVPVCFDKDLVQLIACGVPAAIFTRNTTIVGESPIDGLTEITVVVAWSDEKNTARRSALTSSISRY
jgi:prepilin-type N-terminal cleavage/methylation domain-containing protein